MSVLKKMPLYQIIAEDLKKRIDLGEFEKERRLPAIRDLAHEYLTTTVTVSNALRELDRDGLVERSLGSGIYLKKREDDPFFPVDDLKKIFISVLENEGAKAFEYGNSSGFSGLKEVIRERMNKKIKNMEELEILITSGSQQALHLIFSSMLKVGDWVLVEEPTYPAVIRILKEKGAQIETVKMTETGPDLKELKRIFGSRPLKMAYLMPRYHSPTGFCYDEKTKKTVAELSKKHNVYIVEDNSYGELDFGGRIESPLPVESRFHIYLSSFSKTFLSGARIGCCICAKDIYNDLTNAKIDTDLASPLFFQIVLAKYIKSGQYDLHLKEMNKLSKIKFDEIRKSLKVSS